MNNYIKTYDFTIETVSPIHIGCGKTICKKNYYYDAYNKIVYIINDEKLFSYILNHNLVDKYEKFMLGNRGLYDFCKDNFLNIENNSELLKYRIDVSDVINKDITLKEIAIFMRNAYGQPYIPGSSLKGMLRTILLQYMYMEQNNKGSIKYNENKIKELMSGILISDSLPLSNDDITISLKVDSKINGDMNKLPIWRESLKPNTKIHFTLAINTAITKDKITKEMIEKAISSFSNYYRENYIRYFSEPKRIAKNIIDTLNNDFVFLGGGSGFFSKSLIYPYEEEKALDNIILTFSKSFKAHNHSSDKQIGISPRTLKYTEYKNYYYPMGLCKVKINDISV